LAFKLTKAAGIIRATIVLVSMRQLKINNKIRLTTFPFSSFQQSLIIIKLASADVLPDDFYFKTVKVTLWRQFAKKIRKQKWQNGGVSVINIGGWS
jgi:hypothetical protein